MSERQSRLKRLEAARGVMGHDVEGITFLNELRERLGADSPHLADPEYELTPRGRLTVYAGYAGRMMFFRDECDGTPVACRTRGGRAEFAHVEPDGRMIWTLHPLGEAAQN